MLIICIPSVKPSLAKTMRNLMVGLSVAVIVMPLISCGTESKKQEPIDLLRETAAAPTFLPQKAEAFNIRPEVARKFYEQTIAGSPYREGTLDWDLFMRLVKDSKASGPKILKLLPDVVVEFTPRTYEPLKGRQPTDAKKYRWAGRVTSKGKVVGEGLFIIDENRRRITATIEYNDKVYEIVSLKNGNVRISEIKSGRFPDENPKSSKSPSPTGTTGRRATPDEKDTEPAPAPESTSGSEINTSPCLIDVLVLYTQDAEEAWLNQGYDDIWMEFDKAIEIANEAFAYSNIRAEVRIADRKLVSRDLFQESWSLETDLAKLQAPEYLGASAARWRDEAGADLVNLWVSGGDWCGASPYFNRRGPDVQGKDGFSVVAVGCAAVSKSLAHEIGHNLGARHTRWDEGVPGSNSDHNFGHLSVHDAVRTIMALNKECKDQSAYCRRESHYSNPDISYPGLAIKTGVRIGAPNAADNHAQLNATACQVAAYRRGPSDKK